MRLMTILGLILVFMLGACNEIPDQQKNEQASTRKQASRPLPAKPKPPPEATKTKSPLPTGKPLLLDFTRDHCLPCEIMAPWVADISSRYAKQLGVLEINLDRTKNKKLGIYFKVRSVPTQIYIDKTGREIYRHFGMATLKQMELTLKQNRFIVPAKQN
jgi:thioredoxin